MTIIWFEKHPVSGAEKGKYGKTVDKEEEFTIDGINIKIIPARKWML